MYFLLQLLIFSNCFYISSCKDVFHIKKWITFLNSFTHTGEDSDVITEALTRYKALTFPDANVSPDSGLPLITGLTVHVSQAYKPMDFKMDESCKLIEIILEFRLLLKASLIVKKFWIKNQSCQSHAYISHNSYLTFYY